MSNPNDLKNILIDAARYRWVRLNPSLFSKIVEELEGAAYSAFQSYNLLPDEIDIAVDAELNVE